MNLVLALSVLCAAASQVLAQTCPGAKAPALTAAQSGAMNRARTLGYVPTDAQVNSAANVQRIKRLLPQDKFNYLFPLANMGAGPNNAPYNYQNFLKAAAMFPDLCNSAYGSANLDKTCLLELATMFAMFAQETGAHDGSSQYPQWRQALYYYNELGCPPPAGGSSCRYCQDDKTYPCVAGQYYFGRGPFQLSYNYNYGPFSYVMLGDAKILLNNPGLVTSGTTSWLTFASALWFYMTPQSPKPSMHDVATGFWIPNAADVAAGRNQGFGAQIMIINGGLECGKGSETQHAKHRIEYFQNFAKYFDISAGSNQGCANMRLFDPSGSAAIPQYWERSWTVECVCQLVNYQTPNSIYNNANVQVTYQKCLDLNFPGNSGGNGGDGGNGGNTGQDCSKLTPCTDKCKNCKAVKSCTTQAIKDADCKPCGEKGQTWWPCNLNPRACYCF